MKRKAKANSASPAIQDSAVSTPEPVAGPSQPRRRGRPKAQAQITDSQVSEILDIQADPDAATREGPSTPVPQQPKPKSRPRGKRTTILAESSEKVITPAADQDGQTFTGDTPIHTAEAKASAKKLIIDSAVSTEAIADAELNTSDVQEMQEKPLQNSSHLIEHSPQPETAVQEATLGGRGRPRGGGRGRGGRRRGLGLERSRAVSQHQDDNETKRPVKRRRISRNEDKDEAEGTDVATRVENVEQDNALDIEPQMQRDSDQADVMQGAVQVLNTDINAGTRLQDHKDLIATQSTAKRGRKKRTDQPVPTRQSARLRGTHS